MEAQEKVARSQQRQKRMVAQTKIEVDNVDKSLLSCAGAAKTASARKSVKNKIKEEQRELEAEESKARRAGHGERMGKQSRSSGRSESRSSQ